MPLPKIDVITHTAVIPSTNEEVLLRPFLVKEQKILLTAVAGNDPLEMSAAVKQVINNCVVTPGFDVEKVEVFDLEYLMLQLRTISVGETTKISFYGVEDSNCDECKESRVVEINLKDVKVDMSGKIDPKIALTDTVGVFMRYPTHKEIAKFSKTQSEPNAELKLLWSCIESVYDAESIVSTKDVTVDEGMQFLESLTTKQFAEVEKFLQNMPKLTYEVNLTCGKCGTKQSTTLTGLETFLG